MDSSFTHPAYHTGDSNTLEDIVMCPDLPEDWPYCGSMTRFWMGWKAWLTARGFTLNLRSVPTWHDPSNVSWCIPPFTADASLPYAYCVREGESLRIEDGLPVTRIAWAQDSAHRNIAFKLTYTGSDEYRVYRTLLNVNSVSPTECCGVLRLIAILDTHRPFSFIAMPRWGQMGSVAQLRTVGEATQFMRCTSQGLRLLHKNRIVHRDIHEWNMLINCYNPYSPKNARHLLDGHRSPSDVHYCLFDFNISHIFPQDAPLNACRRPSSESYAGAPSYHPLDTSCGEYDYDPFAFDVGCLGNIYKIYLSSMVPTLPLLAPLFDKMTTHVVAERFTAAEAADFIEFVFASLPDAALIAPVSLRCEWECFENPEIYWARTTAEFRNQWAHFRAPRLPWTSLVLMRLLDSSMGWPLLCFIRRTLCV